MTDLLQRTTPATRDDLEVTPVPIALAALTTAAWAAIVGIAPVLVLVVVAWMADPAGTASAVDAVRVALAGWLLAHGVPLRSGPLTLGLAPLGLSAVVAWQLVRAG